MVIEPGTNDSVPAVPPDGSPAGRLAGKRIVLGVTGGIAAYKAILLCRLLVEAGAHVSPVLTKGALHFVGKTTFDALASERVQMSLWDEDTAIPHTRLGQGADLIVVAPATARLISDYRTGRSHDLLVATLIATRAPVVICPAMHTEMWEHPSVQDNVSTLVERGVHVVMPESGRLAGGDVGAGRLSDPEVIFARICEVLEAPAGTDAPQDMEGVSIVVSAGGTREPIDPVRFIGNRSSGKQGHAIAEAAAARGADVTLVTTSSLPTDPKIRRRQVETAAEMREAMVEESADASIIVMAAAVADFRPVVVADQKIKKHDGVPSVVLEPTVDILAELGANKRPGQVLVGFAAETNDVLANARGKLERKRADLLVANDVSEAGAGFEHDTNHVTIISATSSTDIPQTSKRAVADALLDAALQLL